MGFSTGESLLSAVIEAALANFPSDTCRKSFYKTIIGKFESEDADVSECMGEDDMFDQAVEELEKEKEAGGE